MVGMTLGPLDESAIAPWQRSIRAVIGVDIEAEVLRGRIAESGAWTEHGANYGVWRDGRPLGLVQAQDCPRWGLSGNHEIGILIFDPEDRGRGAGAEALSLFLDVLFVERGAFRVWFITAADNVGMRRIGERCGFQFEGMARGAVELDGELHDEAVYGITRNDPRPALHLA